MKLYKNKKTGRIYMKTEFNVINTTNNQDGQKMICYIARADYLDISKEDYPYFVRDEEEFYKKFEEVK